MKKPHRSGKVVGLAPITSSRNVALVERSKAVLEHIQRWGGSDVEAATQRDEERVAGSVVFTAACVLYWATLHPTVAGGDVGELMSVAHEWGTPHPPGYPTFAFTTKIAELAVRAVFPSVSVGVAQNSFHGLLSAFAVLFLFLATARLARSTAAGVVAAALFGFAPNVWTYAVVSEVFPLNNFFMCLLMLLVVDYWHALQRVKVAPTAPLTSLLPRVRFSAFICGLALTNQHTSVLFVVPVVLWVLGTQPRLYIRDTPILLALFLVGLSPYAYLPLSSALSDTTNSWGELNSWDGFWDHFLRREYGTFSLASKESHYKISNFYRAWSYYIHDVATQTMTLGMGLGVLAVGCACVAFLCGLLSASVNRGVRGLAQFAANQPPLLLIVVVWFVYCNFFNYLSNLPIDQPLFYGVQQRFWIQPLILVAMFAGYGFSFVCRLVPQLPRSATLSIAVALAAVQISINFADRDESQNYTVRDFGWSILQSLPKDAILLTKGDLQINSARYVQTVEGFRRDVRILDQELLTYPWYNAKVRRAFPDIVLPGEAYFPFREGRYDMLRFLDANMRPLRAGGPKRRVFVAFGWKEGDPTHLDKYSVVQHGATTEVLTKKAKEKLTSTTARRAARVRELAPSLPPLSAMRMPPPGRYQNHSWEHVVLSDFQQHMTSVSYELMTHGESLTDVEQSVVDDVNTVGPEQCLRAAPTRPPTASEDARTLFCGLIIAKAMMEDIVKTFDPKIVPTYVRRNLSVAIQTLMRLDENASRRATLNRHMRRHVEHHLTEAATTLTQQEKDNFQSVIRYLDTDFDQNLKHVER
jgi:hypothetical protein